MIPRPFDCTRPVIGMIHVGALPGTPASRLGVAELADAAAREARILCAAGVDGVLVENMHDAPYLAGAVGPEVTSAMTRVAGAVRAEFPRPVGIQILAAANREALAVAHAASLDFVRVEGFAFSHVADEGWIDACAGPLLRYRRVIGADRVAVWADVKKKHAAHAITADVSLAEAARAVEFLRGDAVIVTGPVTGEPPRAEEVREAKSRCGLPVVLGSGVTGENVSAFAADADGFIVGSAFKAEGRWENAVDRDRVERFLDALRNAGAR